MRPDYRLFACVRCHHLVAICTICDRGQWYCGKRCSTTSRREKSRAAGSRYQATPQGRQRHAARQARYRLKKRARLAEVTHQATPRAALVVRLPIASPETRPRPVPAALQPPSDRVYCAVCGAQCAPYARRDFLRRRRRSAREEWKR
jgi:hypothetical protein